MSQQIFRKKSMDRISSPESLNDYIKVAGPGTWLMLGAIILLLAGACCWGVLGRLQTTVQTVVISQEGHPVCYIAEDDISSVTENMKIAIDGIDYEITGISGMPVQLREEKDAYLLHVLEMEDKAWVYECTIGEAIPDGIHKGVITTDSVSPLSFITN